MLGVYSGTIKAIYDWATKFERADSLCYYLVIEGGKILADLAPHMKPGEQLNWLYNLLPDILKSLINSINDSSDPLGAAQGALGIALPGLMTILIGKLYKFTL